MATADIVDGRQVRKPSSIGVTITILRYVWLLVDRIV